MTTLLEQEIAQQPHTLQTLLDRETDRIGDIVAALPAWSYALIAARGTSDHAASYATYAWAALAGKPVALATPSLYTLYDSPPQPRDALVVGVSQSGQSPDIVAVLEQARAQHRPTLAITNDGSSPLAAVADHVIELHAGLERSVAATKTYTASLVVMALLAAHMRGDAARLDDIRRVPAAIQATLDRTAAIPEQAQRYRYAAQCVVLGRGYNYCNAFELALKLKELTYLIANAYSSADFQHGPIATLHDGLPVIAIMPRGRAFDDMRALIGTIGERGADLAIISDDDAVLADAVTPMPIAGDLPEWLSPIATIVPGQMLACHLALARGVDVDQPRGLRKVTRTR